MSSADQPILVGPFSWKTWVRESLVTWDSEARAAYITICRDPMAGLAGTNEFVGCSHRAGPTVEIGDGINLDTDDQGHVIGVEVLGREPAMGDLILVLRWLLARGDE